MFDREELIDAIAEAAADWREPGYAVREEAVAETLAADNAFTKEAVAFAVNQQMSLLTREAVETWQQGRTARVPRTVGVLNAGNLPLVGLQDVLAVVLTGHRYLGAVSSRSPALLPAFVADLVERWDGADAGFVPAVDVFGEAGVLIATGSNETLEWVRDQCDRHRIPKENRLLRGHSFATAVLGGRETEDDFERLAEDILLHEGMGCRSVAVIWAPRGMSPDPLLDALARFRGVFPVHEKTPGRLAMQQAFLEAVDMPHAYGEGLEFLISRGDPEEQQPGHARWSEYDDLGDVNHWLRERQAEVQIVVAGERLRGVLASAAPILTFGQAQRPTLDWCPDGVDTIAFLSAR